MYAAQTKPTGRGAVTEIHEKEPLADILCNTCVPHGLRIVRCMKSSASQIDICLIQQAQRGCQESLARLAERVQDDVYAFLYRMTLNHHLAQDLRQETLLEMVKSLPHVKMEHRDMFWAWIYKIAVSKVSRHYRLQGNRRIERATVCHSEWLHHQPARDEPGLSRLVRQELGHIVARAMSQLTPRHRGILALRCFSDMSFPQIAAVMGGSDLRARVSFFRARQALKRQLQRDGFKKADLLPALTLFAALTSLGTRKTVAAASINASSLEVGAGAAALGAATSKVGLMTSAIAAIGLLALGTAALVQQPWSAPYRNVVDRFLPGLEQRIDAAIGEEIGDYDFINLAMIQDGNLVSVRAYGAKADVERPCRYASVSKAVTAVLVLQMVEEGRIRSLDDDVSEYLPSLRNRLTGPYAHSKLTLRHLLSHTSGLPDIPLFRWRNSQIGLLSEPGREFHYASAGYALLQQILEQASGQSYAQLVGEHIARPTRATSFFVEPENSAANGVFSNVGDMGVFAQALLQGTCIRTTARRDELWTPVSPRIPFGLGWDIADAQSDKLTVSDEGDHDRHRAFIALRPHRGTGIAILADVKAPNRRDLHVRQLGMRLLDLLEP